MSTGFGLVPSANVREDLVRKLGPAIDDLTVLLALPRRRFSTLAKGEVPETAGLYVIYQEEPFEVFYVGKAKTREGPSRSGVSDGLPRRSAQSHRIRLAVPE